jgi:CheY-like chemotaxis protein
MASLAPDDPKRARVEVIHRAGEKAAALTRQLLAFSRKQVLETRPVDINRVVENLEKILSRVIGEDIHLETRKESFHSVVGDPAQLEQVLMNLVVNARDAMPDGGTLTIETSEAILDESYTRIHQGVRPGPHVVLSVSDTGKGIPPDVKEKIFEPFFTTKQKGQGTGLGLATVYGIVRQHNGHIFVYSEVDKGSVFKIYLPASTERPEEEKLASSEAMPKGAETILVVDDDPSIVDIITQVLEPLGYHIRSAWDPREALELAKASSETIDLLLTDVIMPNLNGRQLAESLLKSRPGLRVIFMSGYTDNIMEHHGILRKGAMFVQKPIGPRRLAQVVRQVLDQA